MVAFLLVLSQYIQPTTVFDTSEAVHMDEIFLFNNIKQKSVELVEMSNSCNDLRLNLEEYRQLVENFMTQKNIELIYQFEIGSSCSDSLRRTSFTVELNSPRASIISAFRTDSTGKVESLTLPPPDSDPTISVGHAPTTAIDTNTPVTITATASDEEGISSISIFVDSSPISVKTCSTSPCSTDPTTYSSGPHTYSAEVRDTAEHTEQDSDSFTVEPAVVMFDYTLSLDSSSGSVQRGNSVSVTARATLTSGTTQPVTFSCDPGTVTGISCSSFSSPSCNPTCPSTVTITTTSSTPTGTHPITITGTSSGVTPKSQTYSLTVTPPVVSLTCPSDPTVITPLRTVSAFSIDDLMTAISNAQAGDCIVLADGVYDTTQWLASRSASTMVITKDGTSTHPILVTSENLGGAEIRGPASFDFNGVSYMIVRGFSFKHSQDNSPSSSDFAIRCQTCNFVRFTRNLFELTTAITCPDGTTFCAATRSSWLGFNGGGTNNRVDHNDFLNKKTMDPFLLLLQGGFSTGVDHNYFSRNDVFVALGGECFSIGSSASASTNYYGHIKSNLFEQCNGDTAALSVKATSNVFRHNTFRNNEGGFVLRHGNNNTVDKNFFVAGRNGVRIYGAYQNITNNYFINNPGTSTLKAPIHLGTGTIESEPGVTHNDYLRPNNVLIAFNTLYNNNGVNMMLIGGGGKPLLPTNTRIEHNIIQSDSGTMTNYNPSMDSTVTTSNNILWGSASRGDMPASGYTSVNPQIALSSDGVYRITSTSPARDKGNPKFYPRALNRDMDGQDRTASSDTNIDTGSDEFTSSTVLFRPIQRSEVGMNGPDTIGPENE